MVKEIKNQLDSWCNLHLSCFDHIVTIKMKILPQLVFQFCSLIIFVTRKRIAEIQKLLETFVWEGKNLGLRINILQQGKEV